VQWLPNKLPENLEPIWTKTLSSDGLGGIAANKDFVVVGMRDVLDQKDVFKCFTGSDGELVWQLIYEAQGRLDYGNSPRATPLIANESVYLQGAFGHLHCVDLETGAILWQRNLYDDFGSEALTWGCCWSPVLVDSKLIVQPGAKAASIAALDPDTGETVWQTPGGLAAYSSPLVARFGGVKQIVAYDKETLGGWNVETGERIWTLTPPNENDFNVPTPIQIGETLFVSTENNGSRIYRFGGNGKIVEEPVAKFKKLAPDTHTPVAIGNKVFGVHQSMFCLSSKDLEQHWVHEDEEFQEYCSIVASKSRALIVTLYGQLILVDITANSYRELGRVDIVQDSGFQVHSHPAFVGKSVYFRVGPKLLKVNLEDGE